MSDEYADLIARLAQMPDEAEWLEFKVGNSDPQEIGQQLSALANAAALHHKERAFIVWGIDDAAHEIVGTEFQPRQQKVSGQELENWLCTQLEPQIQFWIREVHVRGRRCVLFEVEPAPYRPVSFRGGEFIRVGSYTKPLRAHPEKEKALWRALERESFETAIATYELPDLEVLEALNTRSYLELSQQQSTDSPDALLARLADDRLVRRTDSGLHGITNLGAILFARDMQIFPRLGRKTVRVVFYKGGDRTDTETEIEGRRGYASGFSSLVAFIVQKLPQSEELRRSLRIPAPRYPEIALRELIANALIHQDFEITGDDRGLQ